MTSTDLHGLVERYYLPVYRPRGIVLDHGLGSRLWDRDGREYVDFGAGIAVNALGHAHPALVAALTAQAGKLWHTSNVFVSEPPLRLAQALVDAAGFADQAFFCNSGAEANEAAIKLARQWAVATGQASRWKIISRFPSYHGGTIGALAVTGDLALTETFAPQIRDMPAIPAPTAYRDRDNLSLEERGLRYADMLDERILAEGPESVLGFIMEPIGGAATAALVPPDSYFPRIREICDKYGILLIHDEVMSGAGRTGRYLGGDHWNCRPDIITMSKGIGSGYAPLGA